MDTDAEDAEAVSFEEAIAKTGGYGPYQRNLLFKMIPVGWTFVFGVSSLGYVTPAIICAFSIDKYQMGWMYSAIYFGMIPLGTVWGASADVFGRRTTIVITCLITAVFEFLAAFATNYWFLFGCKLLSGMATGGVHLTYYIYASEFIDAKSKDTMTVRTGTFSSFGYFLQPLMATFLIPLRYKFALIPGFYELNSWKTFFILSAAAPILGAVFAFFVLEETPKYLMYRGKAEESLRILRDIYSTNLNRPADTFPVKKLKHEPDERTANQEKLSAFEEFSRYVMPLFKYPYLIPASMSYIAQFISMGSYNAVRQHMPTILSISFGLGQSNNTAGNNLATNVSTAVNETLPSPSQVPFCVLFASQFVFSSSVDCVQDDVQLDYRSFMWPAVVSFFMFVSFFPVRYAVFKLGKVTVFLMCHLLSASVIFWFPWATSVYAIIIITIYSACMQNCLTLSVSLMIGRVPAHLRGLTVSLIMVVGRVGVIIGNQVLPVFTNVSCAFGFWAIGFMNLFAVPIMWIYSRQPNPYEEEALKDATKTD